jgi:hypothetical protein
MARMMLKSPGNAAWMRDGSVRGGRRGWASAAWLIAGTLAVALTSYSLSLKVSSERRETDRLARQNSALESELKAMDAELRVRMRMPQLQRWNDDILGMVPISASQYLSNPVHLANYGKPLPGDVPALPSVQLAVRDVPLAPSAAQPMLVSAPAGPAAIGPAARPAATGSVARPAPLPIDPLLAAAAQPVQGQAAPDDLLRQVEMTFQGPPGNP